MNTPGLVLKIEHLALKLVLLFQLRVCVSESQLECIAKSGLCWQILEFQYQKLRLFHQKTVEIWMPWKAKLKKIERVRIWLASRVDGRVQHPYFEVSAVFSVEHELATGSVVFPATAFVPVDTHVTPKFHKDHCESVSALLLRKDDNRWISYRISFPTRGRRADAAHSSKDWYKTVMTGIGSIR
jgi:hypothetical protein